MTDQVAAIVEPFVRRGLFSSPERAVVEMAREYMLHQIEQHQATIRTLENKYGMTYEQFSSYLQMRAAALEKAADARVSQSFMTEEEDALDWKMAREMLQSWLGLQAEVTG